MISIRDVCARDGLQGERPVEPADRAALVARLISAGVRDVEVAAFVSPKAVPAMAGAAEVMTQVRAGFVELDDDDRAGVTVWALVPNARGAELADEAGVDHLTITVSASPAYSRKNTGLTLEQVQDQVDTIRAAAPRAVLDQVISFCFGSSFPGEVVTPDAVAAIVDRARNAGVDRVTLADTTGTATPRRIVDVLSEVGADVGLHLHDTRGTALVNAWAAIGAGIERFDTAVGGLGGSPFAPTAGGNLATEDFVLLLNDTGLTTGIDLDALLAIGPSLAELVGHALPSRVAAAGALPVEGM